MGFVDRNSGVQIITFLLTGCDLEGLSSLRWDVFICKRGLVLIFTPMGLLELNKIDTIGKYIVGAQHVLVPISQ